MKFSNIYLGAVIVAGIFGCTVQTTNTQQTSQRNDYDKIISLSLDSQRLALANKPFVKPSKKLDSTALIQHISYLASDECAGRRPGTPGHANAKAYIQQHFKKIGLAPLKPEYLHTYTGREVNKTTEGFNIIGKIEGKKEPNKYLVISAHYDHLGQRNDKTFYGADDNASGTSALLAMASYFKKNPPPYSIIFAALDREEVGLEGAHNIVAEWEKEGFLSQIVFNVNMDMIARSDNNEIVVCGLKHNPQYAYSVATVQTMTNVKILTGHDSPGKDDWTSSSDHGAFHKKKIPFLYIGVEDHPQYHTTEDKLEHVDKSKFYANANLIADLILQLKL